MFSLLNGYFVSSVDTHDTLCLIKGAPKNLFFFLTKDSNGGKIIRGYWTFESKTPVGDSFGDPEEGKHILQKKGFINFFPWGNEYYGYKWSAKVFYTDTLWWYHDEQKRKHHYSKFIIDSLLEYKLSDKYGLPEGNKLNDSGKPIEFEKQIE